MTRKPTRIRRQVFVLTLQEKKAVACVLDALLLGLATKHYRETHPRSPPKPTARQQHQQQRAEKAAKAYVRSARGQREAAAKAAAARTNSNSTSKLARRRRRRKINARERVHRELGAKKESPAASTA